MKRRHETYLRKAFELALEARRLGDHPFGAVLVDANGCIVCEAKNTVTTQRDCTGHAETNLVREACRTLDAETRAQCTLYTSTEPCAMCAGAIYWGGIDRVVFGLREEVLYEIVGDNPQNQTLRLPCREVFAVGRRRIEVIGPLLEEDARRVHADFWG